jgi:NADPH:quinone reductase
MKSMLSTAAGGPESLVWTDMPDLSPAKGELLVEIRAAGVNFPDLDRTRKSARDDA